MEKKNKTTTQMDATNFKNIIEQMVEYSKQHPGQQCFHTDSLTVYLLVSLQLAASIQWKRPENPQFRPGDCKLGGWQL